MFHDLVSVCVSIQFARRRDIDSPETEVLNWKAGVLFPLV